MKLSCLVLSEMELFADGEAVIACVTQEMLRKTGTRMAESEGIVASLRSVKDVQIAVLLKEKKKEIKVSLRAKRMGNVAEIGMKYGGGGHLKAAGCNCGDYTSELSEIFDFDESVLEPNIEK